MNELSKCILEEYQVRKTKEQKDRFISLMQQHYPQLQVQQAGLLKSRNLVIGDVEKADVILGAHYDTCAKMILPNFISPSRPILSILYSLLLIIPMGILVFFLNFLLGLISDSFTVHYIVSVALWLGLMYLMVAGPENPHTVNDNTSGVLLLCKILEQMSEKQQEKTAVVFFDNEEIGLVGSSCFRKKYKKLLPNKLLINFDCVSDGDYLMIACSKQTRKKHYAKLQEAFTCKEPKKMLVFNSEKVYYPSDQAGFPQHIAIAAMNHKKFLGHYLDKIHTVKDTVMDEANLNILCHCTINFIDLL